MKIPRWKKWLSHLTPITIEETASEHNPELTVALSRGRLQLLSGDAIYSWDDLYQNFIIAFDHLKIDEEPFEDVLILGLGLGSIPICWKPFSTAIITTRRWNGMKRFPNWPLNTPFEAQKPDRHHHRRRRGFCASHRGTIRYGDY
ncbi:MAG: hypothetical protein IPL27_08815 [Lewinellaceae bacterium]|nr:hypothetical protein [Lewinellaceae bacterium]